MNACLQWNPPGISGPEDAPEYQGPTIDELVTQKLGDKGFVQMWAADIPAEVFQLLIDGDYADFIYRFKYEMRGLAEQSAREDRELSIEQWEKEFA